MDRIQKQAYSSERPASKHTNSFFPFNVVSAITIAIYLQKNTQSFLHRSPRKNPGRFWLRFDFAKQICRDRKLVSDLNGNLLCEPNGETVRPHEPLLHWAYIATCHSGR